MNRLAKVTEYAEPFVMVVLVINGLLFCLGALSDHSNTVIVIYILMAAVNFLGSWKVGSHWNQHRHDINVEGTQKSSDSGG